jgi:outer membrane biosynthesis protein TonB
MKSVYFIILLTLALSIKLKRKDYLVNNDDIKNKFLTIMGDMSSALENTIKLMKDNAEKLGVEFSEEKSEENAEEVDEKKQQQKEQKKQAQQQKKQQQKKQQQKKQAQQQKKQTQQQKKEQKEEKPEQVEKVGQQELVAEDNESLEDYELNNGGVDDSEVDAFQMVDDNEGIAQEPDIEF